MARLMKTCSQDYSRTLHICDEDLSPPALVGDASGPAARCSGSRFVILLGNRLSPRLRLTFVRLTLLLPRQDWWIVAGYRSATAADSHGFPLACWSVASGKPDVNHAKEPVSF
jgi:hypothetical protein